MRINDNGIYRDMTSEEAQAMEEAMTEILIPPPSKLEQKVNNIETMVTDILRLLKGGRDI